MNADDYLAGTPHSRYSALPCLRGGLGGDDVHSFSASVEMDLTIHEGKKSEIVANSNTATRMELRPHLPNENVSCSHGFAAIFFDSPPLSIGIPTISARPLSLFMRHCPLKLLEHLKLPGNSTKFPHLVKDRDNMTRRK